MALVISPTQAEAMTSLRSFLTAVLPEGTDAIIAIENRVPQPQSPNCCVMTPIRFQRLTTNVAGYQDVVFTASIAPAAATFTGAIAPAPQLPGAPLSGRLTVSAITSGTIVVGGTLSGPKVATGTRVTSQISGTAGGIGVYAMDISQAAPSVAMTQAAAIMTVTDLNPDFGPILNGATVFGVDLLPDTTVTAFGTGTGGPGTYVVSRSQNVSSRKMSAGARILRTESRLVAQLDFHSINGTSADVAQTVQATFRDQFAVALFAALPPPLNQVAPFYADDPKQMPYQNENQQYEWRWVVEAHMQINQTVRVPQQFADEIVITSTDVDAEWPAV